MLRQILVLLGEEGDEILDICNGYMSKFFLTDGATICLSYIFEIIVMEITNWL